MNPPLKPTLQAMLIADHIYKDAITGKYVVAGIFEAITVTKRGSPQPASPPPGGFQAGSPFAYLSLRDVRGEQAFAIRYVDLSDETVLFEGKFSARTNDPLELVQVALPLPPLRQDKPGTYALELLWNDQPLGSYRVRIIHTPPPDPEQPATNN